MKNGLILIGLMVFGLAGMAQSNDNSIRIDQAIQDLRNPVASSGDAPSRYVGSFVTFHMKGDTRGSRYLFPDWVGGVVTTKAGVVIAKDSLLYNYDKISHDLYLTDQKTVVQVDGSSIKTFTLKNSGNALVFVKLESVKPNVFFQQLVDPGTAGYGFYKLVKTSFEKANYHTDGMVESGHNYDEFIDDSEYYISVPGSDAFKQVELKKKSIREALHAAKSKVDAFFSAHRGEDITESFLTQLLASLN
jgi:hypothetical protein